MNNSLGQHNQSETQSTGSFDSSYLYTVAEAVVAIGAFVGNLLVVIVFIQDKRLRKVTNFYIISLAIADLLVGLIGIPSAILTRVQGIPRDSFIICKTMLSLLLVLCTVSILNLLAVSFDRYWAILHPLDYHRRISEKTAMIIIMMCWVIGAIIGFLPLFGWNNGDNGGQCYFIPIINWDFLAFLYFTTIVLPALMMAFFYIRIYLVVLKQLSYKKVSKGQYSHRSGSNSRQCSDSRRRQHRFETSSLESIDCHMDNSEDHPALNTVSVIGHNCAKGVVKPIKISFIHSRREVKKAQKLFIIVIFFMLCWIPLSTINAIKAFYPEIYIPDAVMDLLIILSHFNSVGSPFLYAFHMKDFREALSRLLCKCAIRQRHFRDLRRQQLFSISGVSNTRRTVINTFEMTNNTCENTPEMTPDLSPNPSMNQISTFN